MTVTADALDMLAGDPPRFPKQPNDFHRHPETGAPYVAHPTETTKDGRPRRVMYGRPSSFGAALDNPFNLVKWKERQLLTGVYELAILWSLIDPDDRDHLDAMAARCHEAAGSSLAADRGTHVHLLCERHDNDLGWRDLLPVGVALGIPTELQNQIVRQWVAFRARLGLTALAVEQTVVNDRWRLAGTLDRLDVADRDILTAYGVLEAGQPFVGDIKTGGLTLGNDGQPNYWVKYPVQLAAYVDAVPYDTDRDERLEWFRVTEVARFDQPNPHIALIYHYDLARALDGEPVDWQAIPVNVDAGREGGDLCRAAADFAKRRDLFAMPAPSVAVPVPLVAVEQPAVDPEPPTASSVVPRSAAESGCAHCDGTGHVGIRDRRDHVTWVPCPRCGADRSSVDPAADRDRLRARIAELIADDDLDCNQPNCRHDAETLLRHHWPEGVLTLKHDGHTSEQLGQILAAVRRVEAEVGAPFHPDDSPPPQSRAAAQRALAAWGDDINGAWMAASLIATFEQCRLPDCTLDGLVGQFSIEQCERLYQAAPSTE
jgi:hypothetical protein